MATAAAALRLLRRRAAAPASLFPRPYSKAAAAVLPTVFRAHVAPPLLRPSLLRFYSSKGTDGTTTENNFLGTQLFNQLMEVGHLKFLVADSGVQTKRVLEALRTCKKAVYMMHDDPDKGFAMWEEGLDDLTRSVAVYKNTIDGLAKATAGIRGSPVDVVLEEGVLSDVMDGYDRTMRAVCAEVEDFLSTSRGDMKKLSRGDEELKTIRMINKGLVALTLGGLSLLLLLALIGM